MTGFAATVLIAEDSTLLAALLRDALLAHGVGESCKAYPHPAAFFTAFAELLEAEEAARLLVIDINLPDESGLDLGRRVRAVERQKGRGPAPIVFFSSREHDEEIERAVADCFPARFVHKVDEGGPARVALEGARLMRRMIEPGT